MFLHIKKFRLDHFSWRLIIPICRVRNRKVYKQAIRFAYSWKDTNMENWLRNFLIKFLETLSWAACVAKVWKCCQFNQGT